MNDTQINIEGARGYLLALEWNLRKEGLHALADKIALALKETEDVQRTYRNYLTNNKASLSPL